MRCEVIGPHTLYNADCREILPTLALVDLCLTDPPFGIGKDGQKQTTGGHGGRKGYEFKGWDSDRPSREVFDAIRTVSKEQVIWGGNYFADMLPATMRWLVWDKGQRINQSDGELAWTSQQQALRIVTMNRVQIMLDGAEHPTQKPVDLMQWCLQFFPRAQTVLDPYMGVASSGVACVNMGRTFIGIELDPGYFDIACRRVEAAMRQPRLDLEPPPKAEQIGMDL